MTNQERDILNEAIEFCSEYWGLNPELALNKSRKMEIMRVRHSIRYYLRARYDLTLELIGELTKTDHSNTINSIHRVTDWIEFQEFKRVVKDRTISDIGEFKVDVSDILKSDRSIKEKTRAITRILNNRLNLINDDRKENCAICGIDSESNLRFQISNSDSVHS